MFIVQVFIHVKPDQHEAFKRVTLENARSSVQEPGCARFDVVQQEDDPTRFVLWEVYRSPEAAAAHRETAHYKKWAEVAPAMMAEERTRQRYTSIFPDDSGWS
ncbi:MAG: putative quinol monooxygenase [Anaerolineae bacterium]